MNEKPDQHDPDWPRYPETVLTFATRPPVEIELRQNLSDSALAQLRAAGFGEPFAIITAFDPEGRNLFAAENEQRKQELDRRLSSAGNRLGHVGCFSPDRS